MYSTIQLLNECGLIEIDWLSAKRDERHKNEHLLQKIIGFVTVYNIRPPITVILSLQHLPRPKEIAVLHRDTIRNTESLVVDDNYVKVTPDIFRSQLDDSYVFDINEMATHYIIIKGGRPCKILKDESLKLINQFSLSKSFASILWKEMGIKRTPLYYFRLKSSCEYFGKNWSVTITFCDDNILRVTAWKGISTPVVWDTGARFIFTKNYPALLLIPERSKNSFSCEIRTVEPF